MEDNRRVTIPLETFIKRSWPMIVAGAVLCVIATVVLFRVAIRIPQESTSPSGAASSTQSGTPTTTAELVPRALDGVLVPVDQAMLQPFAVMVENSIDARPLSGPAEANVVIEAPVEGSITRFMLIFDATTTADQIGPVRSARPYYVDFADGLDAVYAHVGGSAEALQKAGSLPGFRNLDEMANGRFFWRSSKRYAPHNAYTRTELLHEAAAARAWKAGSFTPWFYATTTASGDVTSMTVPYLGGYQASWSYDAATRFYQRYQAGVLQKDADGTPVRVNNVVVLQTDASVLDAEGRLRVRTTGSGPAVIFHDGLRLSGTWHRQAGGWLSFETVDGNDIPFTPGKTWISIVTSADMLPGAAQK